MPPISACDEAAEWFIFATIMDLTMEDERSGRELLGMHNLDERQVKREAQGRRYDQIILDAFSVLQMLYSQRYLGDRTLRIRKPTQGPLYFTSFGFGLTSASAPFLVVFLFLLGPTLSEPPSDAE